MRVTSRLVIEYGSGDLDDYLKSNLYNNGIDLPYHFAVIDKDGREVYRCADYEAKGSEESYQRHCLKTTRLQR